MTGRQFEAAIAALGLTQRGSARRLFHVDERSVRNWVVKGPPNPVALCLALMLHYAVTREQGETLAAALFAKPRKTK